jgi:hypothetical protein
MKNYSIIKLLKQDKCFCKKTNDEITLNDCKLFNCSRWKSCMKSDNYRFNKEVKNDDRERNKN